jgi:hypothetical protein
MDLRCQPYTVNKWFVANRYTSSISTVDLAFCMRPSPQTSSVRLLDISNEAFIRCVLDGLVVACLDVKCGELDPLDT